jgi:ribonuclease HII
LKPDASAALWAHDRAWRDATPGGLIIGIDEVGRGPLAGNVVAACVVLDLDDASMLAGLNDSKKLTAAKRELLAPRIRHAARAWAIGEATPQEIDAINILQATFLAMRRALEGLRTVLAAHPHPPILLVDGNQKIPGVVLNAQTNDHPVVQHTIVKGDGVSASIAAASVLAKVHRDAQLVAAEALYPGYGFAGHKGYGTTEHRTAIARDGLTDIHRKSFCGNIARTNAEERAALAIA